MLPSAREIALLCFRRCRTREVATIPPLPRTRVPYRAAPPRPRDNCYWYRAIGTNRNRFTNTYVFQPTPESRVRMHQVENVFQFVAGVRRQRHFHVRQTILSLDAPPVVVHFQARVEVAELVHVPVQDARWYFRRRVVH